MPLISIKLEELSGPSWPLPAFQRKGPDQGHAGNEAAFTGADAFYGKGPQVQAKVASHPFNLRYYGAWESGSMRGGAATARGRSFSLGLGIFQTI